MIERNILDVINNSAKSLLLLGPRQTGPSTLLRQLKPDLIVNLANEREFLSFARNPGEIFARIEARRPRAILIDEVQRIPSLLNSIQSIIDSDKSLRFFLSGSSARKLARGQACLQTIGKVAISCVWVISRVSYRNAAVARPPL